MPIIFPTGTDMWNSKKEQCTVLKNIHNHPYSQGVSRSKTRIFSLGKERGGGDSDQKPFSWEAERMQCLLETCWALRSELVILIKIFMLYLDPF